MTLALDNLSKRFGGVDAVRGVTLELRHPLVGLIGPNGSGKSTLFHVVAGMYPPTSGSVHFEGQQISGKPTHVVARLGLVRTFQQRMVFESLTVHDNIRTGALLAGSQQSADEVLDFVGLSEYADVPASQLPFGHARSLAVGIALAADPKLILLDEPAAGLNRQETDRLGALLRKVNTKIGKACWIIEHDMHFLLSLVDYLYVMDSGSLIAEGAPDEIRSSAIVRKRYLGG